MAAPQLVSAGFWVLLGSPGGSGAWWRAALCARSDGRNREDQRAARRWESTVPAGRPHARPCCRGARHASRASLLLGASVLPCAWRHARSALNNERKHTEPVQAAARLRRRRRVGLNRGRQAWESARVMLKRYPLIVYCQRAAHGPVASRVLRVCVAATDRPCVPLT